MPRLVSYGACTVSREYVLRLTSGLWDPRYWTPWCYLTDDSMGKWRSRLGVE